MMGDSGASVKWLSEHHQQSKVKYQEIRRSRNHEKQRESHTWPGATHHHHHHSDLKSIPSLFFFLNFALLLAFLFFLPFQALEGILPPVPTPASEINRPPNPPSDSPISDSSSCPPCLTLCVAWAPSLGAPPGRVPCPGVG
jgi:hypothetical protein